MGAVGQILDRMNRQSVSHLVISLQQWGIFMKKALLLALSLTLFSTSYAAEQMTDEEKAMAKAMMAVLSQDPEFQAKFQKMKDDFPTAVKLGKEYSSCLEDADDKPEALDCQKEAMEKAEKLGLEEDDVDENFEDDLGNWSAEEKKIYLQELNADLQKAETAMPCIQAAATILDMAECPGVNEGK